MVELGTETRLHYEDQEFLAFAKDLAMHVAAQNPADVPQLLSQRYFKDTERSVLSVVEAASKQFREFVAVTRIVRWDAEEGPAPPEAEPEPPRDPATVLRFGKRT